MNIFWINVKKVRIYKQIREINSATDYEYLQDELIDRFGEYPDVVAYLKWFSESLLGSQSLCPSCWERNNKSDSEIWTYCKQLFLTQSSKLYQWHS